MKTVISLEIFHPHACEVGGVDAEMIAAWVDGYLSALGDKPQVAASVVNDEVWKPYPANPRYEVSTHGRVRRLPGKNSLGRPLAGRMCSLSRLPRGHAFVSMTSESGEHKAVYVHRAVLETFVGPPPEGKPFALHNNGNSRDNRLENLRWGDNRDNSQDKWAHGTQSGAKLTEEQVLAIRVDQRSAYKIAADYGVGQTTVLNIKNGLTWRHLYSKGVEVGVKATVLEQKESL
jgi:hypothetical protein